MNIPPEGWKLLNAIAGTESPGYDVLYGGQRFSDYSRHPGVYNTITSGPNKGKKSSAAGRYQFLESTWNNAQNALGLPDFSPQSQDQAAWWLANQDYKRRTGRDLSVDVGNREMLPLIRQNLGGTWEGLTKINDSQMFPMFDRAPPVAPGQNTVETAAKGLTLNSTPMNGPTVAAAASLPQAAPAATMAEKLKAMMGSDDFSGAVGQKIGRAHV